jgi:hypothetical protein
MTYGSNEKGEAYLNLTPEEHVRMKAGEPVVKRTADCHGIVIITVTMKRPRAIHKRFPQAMYGSITRG